MEDLKDHHLQEDSTHSDDDTLQEPVGLMLSSILSIEESVERVDSLERSRQLRWIRENS
ncbi:MAG: hypothetical protein ACR2PX_28455 [Endozoicomonas sp.]|uniref:hypothetical protein n=1 Tax=Endozoicomonas sp. TaxID=1892382 RepID=UPI003D9B506F